MALTSFLGLLSNLFYSILGYSLTLLLAFTIIPLFAVLLRLLLIALCSRLYWVSGQGRSPAEILQFSVRIAHPIGFATAIFHGYAAVWIGSVLLRGLGLPLDWFLPVFLLLSFLWWGVRNLQTPNNIAVTTGNTITTTNSAGEETTIIFNPEQESTAQQNDPLYQVNDRLREQLKSQVSNFMQGNTTIGLIGRLTGVILGAMYFVYPLI